ncbi:MAG: DUF3843 family protein [Bacteroidaceae bacterium]|nr:DUF3843 family protein [Bacteroidaceae bacterium]
MPKIATITKDDWERMHPYPEQTYTDKYYQTLATRLFKKRKEIGKECAIAIACYLEDIVSEFGLWNNFRRLFYQHYGQSLPFYKPAEDYHADSVNIEDVKIIVWLHMQSQSNDFVNPHLRVIEIIASDYFQLIKEEFEYAPANQKLKDYFRNTFSEDEQTAITDWLLHGYYLSNYSKDTTSLTPDTPNGPLAMPTTALLRALTPSKNNWAIFYRKEETEGHAPDDAKAQTYEEFLTATGNSGIAFFADYTSMNTFFKQTLRNFPRNTELESEKLFAVIADRQKGIIIVPGAAEYIRHEKNPFFSNEQAKEWALECISQKGYCQPELRRFCVGNNLLSLPQELSRADVDFISRSMLGQDY